MSDYWEERSTDLELIIQKKTDETVKDVNQVFSEAISSINARVKTTFDRYTKSGGLTEMQAKQLLNTKQTAEYRKLLLQKLSETTDKEARKAIITVLDAPAYAYRISMLEALANEIYAEAVMLGAYQNNALMQRLVDIYEQSYYRRTFDIQQYTGEYYDFNRLSSRRVKTAISEPWNGKNYSERVWDNTAETAEKLRDVVIKGIMTGQDYKTMEQALTYVLGINSDKGARFKASRLIRTEVNYISGKATTEAYKEAEIEEYVYLATLDLKTCSDCGNEERKSCADLDGEHFKVSEAVVGVNKHPMHPFCRCSDYPYIPGKSVGKRSARDPKTGKTIQVPADMTYKQWREKFVDKSVKSDIMSIEKQRGIENEMKVLSDDKRTVAGNRRTPFYTLTEQDIEFIKNEIIAIGADVENFVFNSEVTRGTCFLASDGKIHIKGNIFPDEYSDHPRDRLSVRAVLAHEYYGHKPHCQQYLNEDSNTSPDALSKAMSLAWADEFRASYMAAKNAPNLTDKDRSLLIQDALTRAEEAGVVIKYNDFIRRTLYG